MKSLIKSFTNPATRGRIIDLSRIPYSKELYACSNFSIFLLSNNRTTRVSEKTILSNNNINKFKTVNGLEYEYVLVNDIYNLQIFEDNKQLTFDTHILYDNGYCALTEDTVLVMTIHPNDNFLKMLDNTVVPSTVPPLAKERYICVSKDCWNDVCCIFPDDVYNITFELDYTDNLTKVFQYIPNILISEVRVDKNKVYLTFSYGGDYIEAILNRRDRSDSNIEMTEKVFSVNPDLRMEEINKLLDEPIRLTGECEENNVIQAQENFGFKPSVAKARMAEVALGKRKYNYEIKPLYEKITDADPGHVDFMD